MNQPTETDLLMADEIMGELPNILGEQCSAGIVHSEDIEVKNIAFSIFSFFSSLLHKWNDDNRSRREAASFLAGLINISTGNSLSEVYLRVRRLLFHHCREITIIPTWFKPAALNELTKQDDSVLTFEEDLIYGLQFPLDKIHVDLLWSEFIIAMWRYSPISILSINDYNIMNIYLVQKKLDQLLELSSIDANVIANNEITKVAPKKNLRKWWALVQVVFNCPLDNLWWYPGLSILRWLSAYRRWELGYLQPRPELRPVTVQNMAANIMAVWEQAGWLDIMRFK
jgi:hypothetical protein